MAVEYFSFLENTKGQVQYFIGDGRLLIKDRKDHRYDELIADAFSGDSIPVHLITKEITEHYRRRLTPGGIVVFHISNRISSRSGKAHCAQRWSSHGSVGEVTG